MLSARMLLEMLDRLLQQQRRRAVSRVEPLGILFAVVQSEPGVQRLAEELSCQPTIQSAAAFGGMQMPMYGLRHALAITLK